MYNAVIHNFQEQLAWSADLSDEKAWEEVYRALWPDLIATVRIDKYSKFQQWGVDREILLPQGKRFSVDEKKRDADYGDILLEEWSVCDWDFTKKSLKRGRKIGWATDPEKRCDFIAYAIPVSGKCWVLPFEILRQTVISNIEAWKSESRWYPKVARNRGYETVNVAVPPNRLFTDMQRTMCRKFGSAQSLPIPQSTSQLSLEFLHAPHQNNVKRPDMTPDDYISFLERTRPGELTGELMRNCKLIDVKDNLLCFQINASATNLRLAAVEQKMHDLLEKEIGRSICIEIRAHIANQQQQKAA
jgi:hypothetical protein